ncbi:MAG: hypothetical protein WD942_12285 [Dehalococcoidia bacterium]
MSETEGPTRVRVTSDGIECCFWKTDEIQREHWVAWPKPANAQWRSVLDLPVEIAPDVTIGDFLLLFDIPDASVDDQLFRQCVSVPAGPFARWIKPLKAMTSAGAPDHLVVLEIELPFSEGPNGEVHFEDGVPHAHVVSQGHVDDDFWSEHDTWHWSPGSFALSDLGVLPLRVKQRVATRSGEIRVSASLRSIILGVIHWCPPANHSSELELEDRTRVGADEFSPGMGSLREMLGLDAKAEHS